MRKLPRQQRDRIDTALQKAAERRTAAARGGKTTKTLQGRGDSVIRLRVGDYRVMLDLLDSERVILVLGVVHRRDLERWLRGR